MAIFRGELAASVVRQCVKKQRSTSFCDNAKTCEIERKTNFAPVQSKNCVSLYRLKNII
jgi:hypothetical protein